METTKRQQQAKTLRLFRKVHRLTGATLFIVFLFISITGLLLGWKKNSNGYLLAKSKSGISTNAQEWLTIDSLQNLAMRYITEHNKGANQTIERIDIRPEKGMAKFIFSENYAALQIDCTTGKLLQIETRRADFLENFHDGSYIDKLLHIKNGSFKLLYTTVSGLALLLFTITGFWLWYGPKRMKH